MQRGGAAAKPTNSESHSGRLATGPPQAGDQAAVGRPPKHRGAIKSAHRRLALQYHPDKNSAPDAAEIFRRIQNAYERLTATE
jgi:hypothetical protein